MGGVLDQRRLRRLVSFRLRNTPGEDHDDDARDHCERDPQLARESLGVEVHNLSLMKKNAEGGNTTPNVTFAPLRGG